MCLNDIAVLRAMLAERRREAAERRSRRRGSSGAPEPVRLDAKASGGTVRAAR